MPGHHLPVFPRIDVLTREAQELLESYQVGEQDARQEFAQLHPQFSELRVPALADAQLVLALAYGLPSWRRLELACQLILAIRNDDPRTVLALVAQNPQLLHEDARGVKGNWGPPMSYAANLGCLRVIEVLADAGATDFQHALDRACLQGQLETANWLLGHGAQLKPGMVMGPCETLNADGLQFLLDLGAELADADGNRMAPVALVLETYTREPTGKHRCLEVLAAHGVSFPSTPVMALHRGRLDLLQQHLEQDAALPRRHFTYRDVYPLELGCHTDESLGLHGTSLDGTTLLHMCMDFDEPEIARWLLDHGADPNARALIDADGFGGHTPLFNAAVSQAHVCGRQQDAQLARLLLDHGADAHVRASLRKRLRFVEDESTHCYRDVTPLRYTQQFHERRWTCPAVIELLDAHSSNQ